MHPTTGWLPVLSALGLLLVAGLGRAAPASEYWPMWDAASEENSAVVDHSAWQRFLDQYLRAHEDGVNRIAYDAVVDADRQALDSYLGHLAALDPRTLGRNEQFAYWINLYNALTVQVVLGYPDKPSILRMGQRFFSIGPWNDEVIEVAGQALTLNDVEHRILRPIWRDHRIHYAVNCASLGCPNLQPKVYTGAGIESQLATAERDFTTAPRAISFDDRGRLQLSSIYDWYQVDFAADEDGVIAHLAERRPDLAERLRAYDGRVNYEYDWALNSQPAR